MSIESIKIIESCYEEEYPDYVEFEVTHDDGSSGSADLRIMELDETHHMRKLLDEGLPPASKIAETFFYPHSSTTQHRKGIGSQVLDAVLDDAKKRGIRAVYFEASSTIAERFIKKNGFTMACDRHYYKIIN